MHKEFPVKKYSSEIRIRGGLPAQYGYFVGLHESNEQ